MKKIVALVETVSAKKPGHYKAFMCFFTESLLNLGYRVVVLMPDKALIEDWVDEHCSDQLNNFYAYDFYPKQKSYKSWGRFNDVFNKLSAWKNVRSQLKQTEKKSSHKIDLVFFNMLDSFITNYLHPLLLNRVFSYQWSGLYFHPWHLRTHKKSLKAVPSISDIDIVLTSKNCQAVTIHDEGILQSFQKRLLNKKVILFPEIADGTSPNPQLAVVQKIKSAAKGRTIIGMIGLAPYKGLLTLIQIAKKINPQEFFLVFAGKWSEKPNQGYTIKQHQEASNFFNELPEHCFKYLQFINEGADFNALFCSIDIPFLVYNNFASSSNNLTKAAIFKKLVIASKGFCIGDDVENYNLGITVNQGNVDQCIKAIHHLKNKNHQLQPRFEEYTNIHSNRVLNDKFLEMLN